MPESIILHFSDATRAQIFSLLSSRCEKTPERETYFYPNNAEYILLMSEFPDYAAEYDEVEKTDVETALGRHPQFSLSIELRRSKQDAACNAAKSLVSELSATHSLVVDDSYRLWTLSEIQSGCDCLQSYRNKETA